MGEFFVRKAVLKDAEGILSLMKELALVFESDCLRLDTEDLERDGFGDNPKFHCFVAETGTKESIVNLELVGFALCHFRYSINTGTYFYMNGLYIQKQYRGKGVGSLLFKAVAKFGTDNKCNSLQWKLTKPIPETIAFYRRMGADVDERERKFKMVL